MSEIIIMVPDTEAGRRIIEHIEEQVALGVECGRHKVRLTKGHCPDCAKEWENMP